MHFNIKNKMLEVCLLHTPTFIIEPFYINGGIAVSKRTIIQQNKN
jgi:hypothetical protein